MFLLVNLLTCVSSKGFLGGGRTARISLIGKDEFQSAMETVQGCGNPDGEIDLPAIRNLLEPIWKTMPKSGDRVDFTQLRYLAHRYFMQKSSILIRGFERTANVTHSMNRVSGLLNTQVTDAKMYSLEDVTSMVAAMNQLILSEEAELLTRAFERHGSQVSDHVSLEQIHRIMETYIIYWMVDKRSQEIAVVRGGAIEAMIPGWRQIIMMMQGEFTRIQHNRDQLHNVQVGQGRYIMNRLWSWDDAHRVAESITNSFSSFWDAQCADIKDRLVELDKSKSGRVRLADFYNSGNWQFAEAENYLRDQGSLDETGGRGPQVIVPNYLQGASNCIVSNRDHYMVCCRNECEDILSEIENEVGAPTATVEQILTLAEGVTDLDDQAPRLKGKILNQLQQIADSHNGVVPLHGRLFAQWLHYTFPHQCAFPHKSGSYKTESLHERIHDFRVTDRDLMRHTNLTSADEEEVAPDDDELMTQWSEDEELIGDFSAHTGNKMKIFCRVLLGVGFALLGLVVRQLVSLRGMRSSMLNTHKVKDQRLMV